jgi:hypothetical protein
LFTTHCALHKRSFQFHRKNWSLAAEPSWHDGSVQGHTNLLEDRFPMHITAAGIFAAQDEARRSHLVPADEASRIDGVKIEDLNVETVASSPLLPTDRKWSIRFNADGTVTIALGMKDYGRGWFSGYFASVVATRLGISIKRIRLYYNATFPAVLQIPLVSTNVFHRYHMSRLVNAITDVLEGLCDQVIEKGRSIFATLAGLDPSDISFDRRSGRFFVLERKPERHRPRFGWRCPARLLHVGRNGRVASGGALRERAQGHRAGGRGRKCLPNGSSGTSVIREGLSVARRLMAHRGNAPFSAGWRQCGAP